MDRDFDKEKILDKMRTLRNKRDLEILNQEMENINLDTDYKKQLPKDKVLDVKYLGKIDWEEGIDGKTIKTEKEIYMLIEQKENEEGELVQIERYYTEDMEFLGGNNRNDGYDFIMLKEEFAEKDGLLEKLQELDKDGILDLNNLEQERLEEIAKALGVKVEDLTKIDEIDVNQEIDEVEEELNQEEDKEEITEDEVKGLNIKEETSANTYLKGNTLANKLGLEKEGIQNVVKIARVTTTSLNRVTENKNHNQDAFVAVQANGKAVVLGENILKQDTRSGLNPTKEQTTINNDGGVDKETVTSSYLIVNGNGQEYLQVGNDESSGKEIKYSIKSRQTSEFVATELATQRTLPQESNVRRFLNDRNAGVYEADEILKRDKEHGECEEKDVTVIDNDKDNDSHKHFEVEKEYIDKCVKDIMEDETVNDIFTDREIREKLIRDIQNHSQELSIEEIVENSKNELQQDAEMLDRQRSSHNI